MLNKLTIKNFALIEQTEIEFNKGLNILSGETGSGKSILLEALNFVLGAKADKLLIRTGENECFVSAEFDVSNNKSLGAILDEFDFEKEDTLILSRKLTVDGKSSIKVNGNNVTLSMLRKITICLVDIHGQSEHFYLLDNKNQLELIDKFGGSELLDIKQDIASKFNSYKEIISSLEELGGDESNRAIRLDILSYQIKEIQDACLVEGEEEELLEKKKKIINLQKIIDALTSTYNGISNEGNISDILSNVSKQISSIANFSADYMAISERISNCLCELEDVSSTVEGYIDSLNDEDFNEQEIEARLEIIKNIKRKYGSSYQDIMNFLENAKIEKDKLDNFNEVNAKLLKEKVKKEDELFSLYLKLREKRKKVCKSFIKNVEQELIDLGFANSKFEISFSGVDNKEACTYSSKNGIDSVDFLFTANLGEPLKPLSVVISGGEISRFMLAIKAQTAKFNDIDTFIFDEIDTGISGKIAKVVSQKFHKISLSTQIIAITHLPQIFVMGDSNYLIKKETKNAKTISKLEKLDENGKLLEMIRLIGGDSQSDSAKSLANELIFEAQNYKNN